MGEEVRKDDPVEQVEHDAKPRKGEKKAKGQTHQKWKTGGVSTETVGVLIDCPRAIHEELKHFARRTRVPMKRLLLECFLDSLPPEKADRLRADLGPLPTSTRVESAMRQSDKMTRARCLECNRQHEMMPGPGPWHDEKCDQWRSRPTVFVDGEKE